MLQPVFRDDFGVVVEKDQKLARGCRRSFIVRAREIKLAWERDSANRILLHEIERSRVAGFVVHHDHFEIRMAALFKDALQTTAEYIWRVAGRNDDADPWVTVALDRDNLQPMGPLRLFYPRRELDAFQVGVHRAFLERSDLWFRVRFLGHAPRRLPPMVKNLGNMAYARRRFAQAKHELEILHAIERRIETRPGRKVTPQRQQV